MRSFKYLLFGSLFVLFFGVQIYLPKIQSLNTAWKVEGLGGARYANNKPNFWTWAWKDGSFQKKSQQYLKNNNKVIAPFVRANTQIDYELFGEIPHKDLLMGKENTLMPRSSWIPAVGKDFIGKEKIEAQAEKLKTINDYLIDKGKNLLILTPPNKSSAMWEYLPEYYRNHPKGDNNRTFFQTALKEQSLNVIDFTHFINASDQHDYALYPQGGLHWTYYGYTLAADSIKNYIETNFGYQLPKMEWQVEVKKVDIMSDRELFSTANFLNEPELEKLPYPKITYDRDSADLIKVLSVGDSYYKLLYDYGIHQGLFHEDSPFWYYASTLFPPVYRNGKKLNNSGDLDVLEVVGEKDLVILTVVEGNLKTFGWGWVERTYGKIKSQNEN